MDFFKSYIKTLLDMGHTVDIATNENSSKVDDCYREWGCNVYQIDCSRSPLNKGNLKAISQIKKLVDSNGYDIVHCHTPIAAMCTRLACIKSRKKGTKVFYTAHGFHFYKGAPLKNWIIFYPIEKLCSYFTDVLITINKEDYALAKKKFKAKKVEYVPGVGIDVKKFRDCEVSQPEFKQLRYQLDIPEDAFVLLSVGELNQNKNHEIVLRAISNIKDAQIHYMIAGTGERKEYLLSLAKELGIEKQFHLLGYRNDVEKLYKIANAYVHPSFREGLPVSVMEAMASGLPCVVSKIRGNEDLVDECGGFLFTPHLIDECKKALTEVLRAENTLMSKYNKNRSELFSDENILSKMVDLYHNLGD